MNPAKEKIIEQTKAWIDSFIIEYNICPFAQHVIQKNGLQIDVNFESTTERALESLLASIDTLEQNQTIETILLIFPNYLVDFYDYLDFTAFVEDNFFNQDYEGIYQLATFHPNYCFAEVDQADVSNYTNRSPYPMLHLLRENSIDKAIEYYGDTEKIPENNIKLLRSMGLEKVKKIGMP